MLFRSWQQAGGVASDVLLVGAFVGSKNCFPTAPNNSISGGVNLGAYAPNALGNGISWPTADAGIDITSSEYATIAAEDTALERLSQTVADQIVTRLALFSRKAGNP